MSCLFRSLASFLPHTNPSELRARIAHYLSQDPEWEGQVVSSWISSDPSSFFECSTLGCYIGTISKAHVWGGALEIRAFCELFQKTVRVHATNSLESPFIEFSPSSLGEHEICHLYYNGSHYEPIIPVSQTRLFSFDVFSWTR